RLAQGQDALRRADPRRQVPRYTGRFASTVSEDGVQFPGAHRRAFRVRRGARDGHRSGTECDRFGIRADRSRGRGGTRWHAELTTLKRAQHSFNTGELTMTTAAISNQATDRVLRARAVEQVIAGHPTSDGAGVRLTRVLTQPLQRRLDPFLMLD